QTRAGVVDEALFDGGDDGVASAAADVRAECHNPLVKAEPGLVGAHCRRNSTQVQSDRAVPLPEVGSASPGVCRGGVSPPCATSTAPQVLCVDRCAGQPVQIHGWPEGVVILVV